MTGPEIRIFGLGLQNVTKLYNFGKVFQTGKFCLEVGYTGYTNDILMDMSNPKIYTWIPFGRPIDHRIKRKKTAFLEEKNISKTIFFPFKYIGETRLVRLAADGSASRGDQLAGSANQLSRNYH